VFVDQGRYAVRAEWGGSAKAMVEDAAQRVDIRADVHGFAGPLLRGHIRGSPNDKAGRGDALVCSNRLCQAEVHDLHESVLGQHDIAGLDVAVHHAMFHARAESLGDAAHNLKRLLQIQGGGINAEKPLQVYSVYILHREIGSARVLTDCVDLDDVGVNQARGRACFAVKAFNELLPVVGGSKDLQGHPAVQRHLAGTIDLAHAAFAQKRFNDEFAEYLWLAGHTALRMGFSPPA